MIESCTGTKAKEEILSRYEVSLVTRMRLYDGQSIKGCCGPISTEYFVFSARADNKQETIVVGSRCGREFIRLLDEKIPPMFDAQEAKKTRPSGTAEKGGGDGPGQLRKKRLQSINAEEFYELLTPLNRQFYDAIHLLVASWNGVCSGTIAEMLIFLRKNPHLDTKPWAINAFGRIVQKDTRKRSLTAMAAQLRKKNPELEFYNFNLLNDVLEQSIKRF